MANVAKSRRPIYITVAVVIVIAVVVAIVVPVSLGRSGDSDESEKPVKTAETSAAIIRHDCYPEAHGDSSRVDQNACDANGCVFDAYASPPCFQMEMKSPFQLDQMETRDDGQRATLTSFGEDNSVNKWQLDVLYINDNLLRFTINNAEKNRYTVPVPLHFKREKLSKPKYEFHVKATDTFAFHVVRKDTGTVIWDMETEKNGLILTDQLLQISTRLPPSSNVFGLGENRHNSFRHVMNITWPAFARDQSPSYDEQANLYGVHPFYSCVEDVQGNSHGILLFNSNAQEYAFSSRPSLTYRTIGGILDFFVFMGPSPENVVQQYTQLIGRPMMPPYWALGFQLCRYGYNTIDNMKAAVESTRKYGIPQDVQYVDIDHMEEEKDFTIDQGRFPGLNDYFKSLQASGMRIIYLLDPCLMASDDYKPYQAMKEADGAIKWPRDIQVPDNTIDSTGAMLGYVWPPNPVIFPDFFKKSARDAWKKLVKDYRANLTYDGLWIDMNEPASFNTNDGTPWNWPKNKTPDWSLVCPNNSMEDPPYRPKAAHRWDDKSRRKKGRLSDNTICLSTVQGETGEYRHYDVHSLYGWSETRPTLEAAQEATGERSVIITRSTFPGTGNVAGHWLGDNRSRWPDLSASIIGMLEFNLFGIPYVGADICGFNDNTTESLCLRWMQLGAFYPFSRNHNAINSKDQGPGQLGDRVGEASAKIMLIRYNLLPYLYTLFHQAHIHGSTVVRPLHHEFPKDVIALSIDRQFLWGSCLMICPILEENQTVLRYYLPKGKWYNYFTNELTESSSGQWHSISVNDDSMPELFMRGGFIIVQQKPSNNTQFSRQNPLTLLVALDERESAKGHLFWDDGVSIDTYEKNNFFSADFTVKNANLSISVTHQVQGHPEWQNLTVEKIVILGVTRNITKVEFNDQIQANFSQTKTEMIISLQNLALTEIIKLSWM